MTGRNDTLLGNRAFAYVCIESLSDTDVYMCCTCLNHSSHRDRRQMSVFVVLRLEERIAQCDSLNALHARILCKFRIDVEEDRHVHRFPSIQSLLLEAETLNLAKVWSDLSRCNGVGGYANDVFWRFVGCSVESESGFAREDSDFALLRNELPR